MHLPLHPIPRPSSQCHVQATPITQRQSPTCATQISLHTRSPRGVMDSVMDLQDRFLMCITLGWFGDTTKSRCILIYPYCFSGYCHQSTWPPTCTDILGDGSQRPTLTSCILFLYETITKSNRQEVAIQRLPQDFGDQIIHSHPTAPMDFRGSHFSAQLPWYQPCVTKSWSSSIFQSEYIKLWAWALNGCEA